MDVQVLPVAHTPARAPRKRRGTDSYDNIEPMFLELAALSTDDPRREALREELIRRCLPLAEHIARKFAGRGENLDDLLQVARMGMLAAIYRFNPTYGSSFLGFAIPTITGEVRRHFRDYTWSVRVPRRLKEIQQTIAPTIETLSQQLGRMPTAAEIADEIDADLIEVTQALIARNGYHTSSIDAATDTDNTPLSLRDSLGDEIPDYAIVEECLVVKPLIAALPERERQVLIMRFYEFKSQSQIAGHLGVSQMQVSRILSQTLNSLREQALRD